MAVRIDYVNIPPDLTLEYAQQGAPAGQPLVLLHGFGDSWHTWERVLPHLPERELRVYALSQRGHGNSDKPADGYGIDQLASDLAAFLAALGLERVTLCGHSMGGAVVTRYSIDHPERVNGLILVGASTTIASSAAARDYWRPLLANLHDPVDPAMVRRMITESFVQPVPDVFREMLIRETAQVPARVWREVFHSRWQGMGEFAGQLGEIKAPVLVLAGERDRRYPPAVQQELAAQVPQAHLKLYARCGHCPHWEEPERFARDAADFLLNLHQEKPDIPETWR
ncbi:MAG: alpha/beta fold hydrolase [Anaerolineae bacterium]